MNEEGGAARAASEDRYDRAIARFDAANAEDPNQETVQGRSRPKELVYAERMSAMLARFAPDASEVLRLAARCQHIRRWTIPRGDYEMDRIGYLQWRKRLNKFHAQVAGDILRDVGYDNATIARVGALLKKESLKADTDAQALRISWRSCSSRELSCRLRVSARRIRSGKVRRYPIQDGKEDVSARREQPRSLR